MMVFGHTLREHKAKKAIVLCLAALFFSACDAKKETPVVALVQADPNVVVLTERLTKEVKLYTVSKIEMRDYFRVPASIQVDEQRMARIGASVTGRIKDIEAALGQSVKQGQVLATLNSTELAQSQLMYIKSTQQIGLQTKAVDRAKLLQEADVIGKAELQRREVELSAAQAELNAARDQLLVLGMNESAVDKLSDTGQIRSYSNVNARISGTVISRKVNLGQVVQPAEELFIIADLSRLWVVAEVPEQQIELIDTGEEVLVEIPALNYKKYKAKLIFEGDIVNPQTRTVTVRSDIANIDKEIKPDMLASMLIKSNPMQKLAVPLESIVRENDLKHVYVQIAPKKFKFREVSLGLESDGLVEITSGIEEGDIIVAEGAFHVNNERKRKELE